jgi:energy-coupling factor transporter ATP-binding protein EcfA2
MLMTTPIISFKNFSFRYKTQQAPTLKHINLNIYPGEKVLILGPSGSGKSTLGKCLNGLIPNHDQGEFSGTAVVNGKPVAQASIFQRSRDVGTVLQDSDAQFVGLSVGEDISFYLENLATPLAEMKMATKRAATQVDIDHFLV